jgi:hypothetical protein
MKHTALIRDEEGQALIWGAAVLLLIVVLFYGAIDLGQLVLGKIEAQNGADAAAMTSAAMKASMHNTRSLAYRAASGQLDLARLQMLRATGLGLDQLDRTKATKNAKKDFDEALKKARLHRTRLERLRDGVVEFNKFATGTEAGPEATKKAAEEIYKANLGLLGLSSGNGRLATYPEIDGGAANGKIFKAEAMDARGHARMSAVVVKPKAPALGGGLLGYGNDAALSATAVAGSVEAHQLYGKNLAGLDRYGIEWYTVRLMPVGKGDLGE